MRRKLKKPFRNFPNGFNCSAFAKAVYQQKIFTSSRPIL
ncbi:hypothetical protein DDD_2628 [Nonlabens dokdonensis DSW-6]|uniref:Uncharacterized protein n=1 Tax=Nonlabens dokdonensis (strain DSM 17205 / KCTC 12402 / DSW-6) TaxID=592029 RepID=L7W7T3_NONDD|nr:hypothetical protein DDD_2628 [Nonlabens dokdonensis DSW-6]